MTFIKCDWLDGKHTVFGRVNEATLDVLDSLEAVSSEDGTPKKKV